MQHRHFDLDKIERDIRHMYATTPAGHIHDEPEVVAAFRRAADVEVAMAKWFFNGQMAGVPAEVQLTAIVTIISTLIMNRVRSCSSNEGSEAVLDFVMNGIVYSVSHAFENEQAHGLSDHAIAIQPVTSGSA